MALAVTSSSATANSSSLFSRIGSSSDTKVLQIGSLRISERTHVSSGVLNLLPRRSLVRPLNAESHRNGSVVPLAATIVAPEILEKEEEDFEKLAKNLENASPLEIMDKALEKFGKDIAIAFSGAEDVALIEYAHLTGSTMLVKSLSFPSNLFPSEIGTNQRWAPSKSSNSLGFSSKLQFLRKSTQNSSGVGPDDAVIIVDHGSRRQESNLMLNEFVEMFRHKTGYQIVEPAHMELAEPSIRDAFQSCVRQGAHRVIISPFFLGPGRHWSKDIPSLSAEAAKQHPGVSYIVAAPLGLHELLVMADNGYGSMSSYATKMYEGLPPLSTLEMLIPANAVGKVMGKGGANLANIMKISGATVEISESKSYRGERVALISGTSEEKRAAENLIQAFIMAT